MPTTTTTLSYRHRSITPEDIDFIRNLIAANPELSRWSLSKKLCQSWNWVQTNGALREATLCCPRCARSCTTPWLIASNHGRKIM